MTALLLTTKDFLIVLASLLRQYENQSKNNSSLKVWSSITYARTVEVWARARLPALNKTWFASQSTSCSLELPRLKFNLSLPSFLVPTTKLYALCPSYSHGEPSVSFCRQSSQHLLDTQ